MKSQEVARLVILLIRKILITEQEIDDLKITLAENIRFDISDAFRSIDYNLKGYLLPADLYRFLAKNGHEVTMKICEFWIHELTGSNQLTYKHFIEMIVPRYDREAAMTCISRKLYTESVQCKYIPKIDRLTFYLEEFVAKLLLLELRFLEEIEVEKLKLAQLVQWKFMEVFRIVVGGRDDVQAINQATLNAFLENNNVEPLTDPQFLMFLKRFNRNDDKLIQRDEFSDAIFPSGFLMNRQEQPREGFHEYIQNQNQELDHYLGTQPDQDDFRPEEHMIKSKTQEKLIRDESVREYLTEDPQLFVPKVVQNRQTFLPMVATQPISNTITPNKLQNKSKKYTGLQEQQQHQFQSGSQQQDLLVAFEKPATPNRSPMGTQQGLSRQQQAPAPVDNSNQRSAIFYNNLSLQQSQFQEYVLQPSNKQLLLDSNSNF